MSSIIQKNRNPILSKTYGIPYNFLEQSYILGQDSTQKNKDRRYGK